jgi:hypothetical protein
MEQKDIIFEHLKSEISPAHIRLDSEDTDFVYLTVTDNEDRDPEEWKVSKADYSLYTKDNFEWEFQYKLSIQ